MLKKVVSVSVALDMGERKMIVDKKIPEKSVFKDFTL